MSDKELPPPPPMRMLPIPDQLKDVGARREVVKQMIQSYDEAKVWDRIQGKDVPHEILDYVDDALKEGWDYNQIRRQLGIYRTGDKSWTKIMSALKRGFRINGTAFLVQKGYELQRMSDKLRDQIMNAFEKGVPIVCKDQDKTYIEYVHGPTKELSAAVDAYNRLQQGFVKLGKDLGAFVEENGKQAGGVTIVVQNNIPIPDQTVIDARHASQKEKDEKLVEEAKVILTTGGTIPDGNN